MRKSEEYESVRTTTTNQIKKSPLSLHRLPPITVPRHASRLQNAGHKPAEHVGCVGRATRNEPLVGRVEPGSDRVYVVRRYRFADFASSDWNCAMLRQ